MGLALPTVSVIIPTHDRARFLPDAIASVREQGVDGVEVVVVDDGSTDDTRAVIEATGDGVRYVRQEHLGVSAARNRGLAEARAALIAFLDSDDVWPAGSLRHRLGVLEASPHADIVFGMTRIRCVVPDTKLRRYREGEAVRHSAFGSMLIRRSAFDAVGPIDEGFSHSEDVEWLFRAREKGIVFVETDEVVLEYRIHDGNMTSNVEENRAFLFRALKQSLDRRRSGGSNR